MLRYTLLFLIPLIALHGTAQNVVEDAELIERLDPIQISENDLDLFLQIPYSDSYPNPSPEGQQIQQKLNRHVQVLLEGHPWKPFYHTLGISGYEIYFSHPDELVYSLALALPFLTETNRQNTIQLIDTTIPDLFKEQTSPPETQATKRERYLVPDDYRHSSQKEKQSLFPVYAAWLYEYYTPNTAKITDETWEHISKMVEPMLSEPYPVKMQPIMEYDEAETLNEDIAGLLGYYRLAQKRDDLHNTSTAATKLRELLEMRINLERTNPNILQPTHSSSKTLHVVKLARYVDLAPEIGRAVRQWAGKIAIPRLEQFRAKRPTWYMAFGDRLIGGENYTNPPHFSRALFAAGCWIENLAPHQLYSFIDIPWCKADLFFIEKCAFALMNAESTQ